MISCANTSASSNHLSDSDYVKSSLCRSPSCDDSIIHDLNCGKALHSPCVETDIRDSPDNNQSPIEMEQLVEFDKDSSMSVDETWSPSVDGKDSDEDYDMDAMEGYGKKSPSNLKTSLYILIRLTLILKLVVRKRSGN